MVRDSDLVALSELTYAAGTDSAQWPVVLERLGGALKAPTVTLLVQDLHAASGTIVASHGFPPDLQRAYNEYYAERNVWMIRGRHLQVPGRVRIGEESCPEGELLKTEFYNDYMRPLRVHHAIGGTILQDGSLVANVSALRGKRAGVFENNALRALSARMPHLRSSIETHRRLAGARLEEQVVLEALDRLPTGVILLDSSGRPVFVNAEARRILEAHDGLSLDRGVLSAARPRDTQALRARVASAATPGRGGGHLALGRPSLLRPLGLDVVPLTLPTQDGLPPRVVGIFVVDPDRQFEHDATVVARLYGLTPAESELATRLVAGDTLEGAADRRGITRETARTHLKRILRKTGARSQVQLLRQMLQGPARMVGRALMWVALAQEAQETLLACLAGL